MKELYMLRMLQALKWTIFIQLSCLSLFGFTFQLILSLLKLSNVPYRPFSFWIRIILFVVFLFLLCARFQKDSRILERSSSNRIILLMRNFLYENLWTGVTLMLTGAFANWAYLSFLLPYNHTVMYSQCQADSKLLCVNEVFVFIFTLGLWEGLDYFLNSYIFKQHEIFAFKANQQTSVFQDIKLNLKTIIVKSFIKALKPTLVFIILYSIFRDLVLNFIAKLLFVHVNDKLSLFSNVHFILIALLTNSMFLFATNLILFIFNVVLTKRHVFTIKDLMQALAEDHQILCIKKLVYLDLVLLTEQNPDRRREMYKLSQPGGHPKTWNFVKEKCLQNITDYMKLLDHDNSKKDKPIVPPALLNNVQLHNHSNMRNLVEDASFKPAEPKKTNLIVSLAQSAFTRYKNNFYQLKTLPIYTYLVSNEQIVLSQLNDYQCVLWSIRSLTALICEALNEEAYGVISNDINDIILILLDFKNIVEDSKSSGGLVQYKHSVKHKYKVEIRYCIIQCLYKISNYYASYLDSLNLPKNALLQLKSLSKVNINKDKAKVN
uniref:Nucleoporin NDC1 n=1 Tax=Cacopsylla melanoneura TaxID=428564 RepID=A0A8D8R5U2_9HEMI